MNSIQDLHAGRERVERRRTHAADHVQHVHGKLEDDQAKGQSPRDALPEPASPHDVEHPGSDEEL